MSLSDWGRVVLREWNRSSSMRAEIELDAFVIMPNHIHGIIFIHPVGACGCTPETRYPKRLRKRTPSGSPKKSLSSFVLGFKSAVTAQINSLYNTPGKSFWQRNYHEHVIRDEKSLLECRTYIEQNPLRWAVDKENPKSQSLL